MNPPMTAAAFHHFYVEIIVFIALLTHRTIVSLLPEFEARRTHWQVSNKLRNICRAATFAFQTVGTDQWPIGAQQSLARAETR